MFSTLSLYFEDSCVKTNKDVYTIADKPARRLRKVCTVYVRAVGL